MKIFLRELLLVMAIIAIGLGWLVDHRRLKSANAQLNAENVDLINRVLPSSGFAIPSGISTAKSHHLLANPEDRKELLWLLDRSRDEEEP